MAGNLNINKLNQYADRFATRILNQTYQSRQTIGGDDLLKLTPVRQVNLGILNRLFDQWKNNALAFRSVYFDFENEEVKHALEAFMNTASQHISVKKEDLEPLLKQSVRDALILLYTPETYFDEKLKSLPDALYSAGKAQDLVRYTHIHQGVAKAMGAKLTESQTDSVSVVRASNWLQDVLKDTSLIDSKDLFEPSFSEVTTLSVDELFDSQAETPVAAVPRKDEPKSFFDSALSEIENIKTVSPGTYNSAPEAAVHTEAVSQTSSAEKDSLNSRFKVDIPKPSEDKSYGSVQVKVESIAGSIPLGQRFMFVNQLFGRNSEHFEKAIYELDSVKSFAEAEDLIWHRYASKHAWDVNGEAVSALLSIVKRKFNN